MWASCCGLLNEVMGTGAVRGQQAGFSTGTGPFRFAPNAGFSTYPPASSSTSAHIVCKACGLAFSVFRKKHVCCECKKNFCSLCSVIQENLRRCSTCHLLRETAFQRPQLMRLKVKDLRQYLTLRNIPTDTCREKEDLVELVLYHHGSDAEDEMETSNVQFSGPQTTSVFTYQFSSAHSFPSQPPPTEEESDSRLDSGNEAVLEDAEESFMGTAGIAESQDHQIQAAAQLSVGTNGLSRKRVRASLSDLSSIEDIEGLNVRQLKEILARNFVNYSGCCEKWELVEKVNRLYRETEGNRMPLENVDSCTSPDTEKMQLGSDDNLCRICMDAVIDCVLLECGHMVTCTKCGKRMSECPICRQFVVRAVHVFRS